MRQWSVLSPYLFTRYIRDLIYTVVETGIACKLQGKVINLLAYADDLVLLALVGCVDFINVRSALKLYCLNLFVCACMMVLCGRCLISVYALFIYLFIY